MSNEISIQITDLDDVRQALGACIVYFQAEDLKTAQVEFRTPRPSPLTTELERVKERFDSYLGDYLLQQHEASLDEEVEDEFDEEVETEEEEELSPSPLGEGPKTRSRGRRLPADEV